jgi:hypothetical protein
MVRNLTRNQAPGNRLWVRIPCPPLCRGSIFDAQQSFDPIVSVGFCGGINVAMFATVANRGYRPAADMRTTLPSRASSVGISAWSTTSWLRS